MGFETNEDGSLNFIEKNFYKRNIIKEKEETKNEGFTISSLYSCNIQTSVPNFSLKIETKEIVSILQLNKIVSFDLSNDSIFLTTSDEQNYYLYFVSELEAVKGYDKIEEALNGNIITCTDALATVEFTLSQYNTDTSYSTLLYPAIIFIDNLEPIEVTSKNDLINKLNNLYSLYGNVTDNINNWMINFSYLPYKKEYLPKTIRILPRHLEFEVIGKEMFLIIDLLEEKFFLFEEGVYLKSNLDIFSFINPDNKKVRIYFSQHQCYLFELRLAEIIKVIPVPPVTNFLSNSPNIISFKSSSVSIKNLSDLLLNSIDLVDINIKDCGYLLPSFTNFSNLKSIFIENSINSTLLINSDYVNTIYLKNVKIISLNGSFSNLISLKLVDCGALKTINITNSKLREFNCINNSITTLNISSTENKIYIFEVVNTNLSTITLSNTEIKSINFINIGNNKNLILSNLNSFLTQIKNYNTSQGGYLNIKNPLYNITSLEEILIDEIIKRGWMVEF